MTIRQQNNDGFTLLEVLIATAVFSIGIIGVALMQVKAIQGNSFANHLSGATAFASSQAEKILSWKYDDNRLDPNNDNSYPNPGGNTITADGYKLDDSLKYYHAYWDVKDDTPQAGSKTIDITVRWNYEGKVKSFTLQTVKANKNYLPPPPSP